MSTTPPQQIPAPQQVPPDLSLSVERLMAFNGVNMELTVEIGRTTKPLRDILKLTPGEVVVLDRPAGAPADLYVNGSLMGHGQVVESNSGEYAIRITEVLGGGTVAG